MKRVTKKLMMAAMVLCLTFGSLLTVNAAESPSGGTTTAAKLTASSVKKSVKVKTVKKGYSFKVSAKLSDGSKNITYKKTSGCKYVKISKAGKVTVSKTCKNKKLHKGSHSIKVKVTGTDKNGKKTTKTITVKVLVK